MQCFISFVPELCEGLRAKIESMSRVYILRSNLCCDMAIIGVYRLGEAIAGPVMDMDVDEFSGLEQAKKAD